MSVYSLIVKIFGQDAGASQAIKGVSSQVTGLQATTKSLGGAMDLLAVGGFAFAGKAALSAAWDLGELGAKSLGLKASFQDLATQAGGSADAMLAAIREASSGAISEMDMMASANRGILLGLGANADQWGQLTEVARYRAKAMGLSMTEALDNIAMGIGRESRLILDNLGIILDLDTVTQTYAQTLGKTADELTASERKQAILNSVISEGQAMIAASGGIVDGYATSIAQMSAEVDNAKVALGEALAPAVAAVAGAIADAIPRLAATTQQLTILAGAGVEWAQAALDGQNATAAFNASIADSVGATEQAAQIRADAANQEYQAAIQVMSGLQAAMAAEQAYLATQEEGTMAYEMSRQSLEQMGGELEQAKAKVQELGAEVQRTHPALITLQGAELAVGSASQTAASGVSLLVQQFQALTPAARVAAGLMDEVSMAIAGVRADLGKVSAEEIGQGFTAAAGQIEGGLLGMVGTVDTGQLSGMYDQYLNELQTIYENAGDLTDFELKLQVEAVQNRMRETVDALNQGASQQKGALDTMSQQYSNLRSTIQSALQGTTVTAEDMGLSAIGEYADKWDENARRLDAIAQRGFAEIQEHADWAAALKIPPEVMAAGEEALKAWASRTAGAVRELTRPDLINLDAAVAAVEQFQREQAAKEITIDLVIARIAEKGGLSEEEARRQVMATYGLEDALPVSLTLAAGAKETFTAAVGTVSVPATLEMAAAPTGLAAPATGAMIPGMEGQALTVSLALVDGGLEAFLLSIGTVPVPVTLSLAGEGAAAQEAVAATAVAPIVRTLVSGFRDAMDVFSPAAVVAERVTVDVIDNAKLLVEAGEVIWDATEAGLIKGIKKGDYAEKFVQVLVPIILRAIKEWGEYG